MALQVNYVYTFNLLYEHYLVNSLIAYFVKRPVISNVLMFGLIFSAVITWQKIGKEEMPEFSMNWIRVNLRYPGASARDVELFVIKPIEEKLKGVTGLEEVASTSSYGVGNLSITFEPNQGSLSEKIQEVKDAIESVPLPREVEDPVYRQFRSSEKAIIDIGIYLKGKDILDTESRYQLQEYVLAFQNRLISLNEISGVDANGYLRPELQIKVDPAKLHHYELSMAQVREQVIQQNVRRPIGSLKDRQESEVTIISELVDPESLKEVIVTSGFQGQKVKLEQIATIERGFEKNLAVKKVQGHEGIILNVKKSSNTDIISAQQAIVNFIDRFKANDPDSPIEFVLVDDESYDVRNRIALIASNGIFGFILIVIVLFLFLDLRAGVWVAMGIPFSLAFTLICAWAIGYTINNMTLASIIIVLGIVVDDAIIIAENIQRKARLKEPDHVMQGTAQVIAPIIASILTTCAAFIPLFFFSGHFGLFVKYIPTVVFLMLLASLLESLFILPSHMAHPLPFESRLKSWLKNTGRKERMISSLENGHRFLLNKLLPFRSIIMVGFVILLGASAYLFKSKMKFVMFPREESKDFVVKVVAKEKMNRYEMAKLISKIENVFLQDEHRVVTAVLSTVGQSRRGGEVRENEANIRVEITPPTERTISLNQLFEIWQKETDQFEEFEEIRFMKSRWGFDSGSAIEIEVQENNDNIREQVANSLQQQMNDLPFLTHVEIERPITKNEYQLDVIKSEVSSLGINYEQLANTLRAYIEGDILYTFNSGEEEVDVRFTSIDEKKDDIHKLLAMTIQNKENYLVPISGLVKVEQGKKPANISRVNYKRTTKVYADIASNSKKSPLEVAEFLEKNIFNKVLTGNPSTVLTFRGEVEESRDSQSDFSLSLIMVLTIIYILLVFLFDSITVPFLIAAIIPFGIVGVVIAFWAHGMIQYGFFAVIGTLGMIGVVINDSIVLVDKLESEPYQGPYQKEKIFEYIANITATRLRAVVVTTLTTVAGLFPTAYGFSGYDSMLAEMMLAMGWGLLFGMFITLLLIPCLYSYFIGYKLKWRKHS